MFTTDVVRAAERHWGRFHAERGNEGVGSLRSAWVEERDGLSRALPDAGRAMPVCLIVDVSIVKV